MTDNWTEKSIPDLTGKTYLVTGANSGIGWETARVLADHNAHVVVAARSQSKADDAIGRIEDTTSRGDLEPLVLDLADLESVTEAADSVLSDHATIHGLINNAGIMAPPYGTTAQGFEQQLGVNHLGHFALTGLLMPILLETEQSRVVNVSSLAHTRGRIQFDDLHFTRDYSPWTAYAQSKLANLLFTSELERRLQAIQASTIAVAAHPGVSSTNLGRDNAGGLLSNIWSWGRPLFQFFLQPAAMGALPTLRATTDPQAAGDDYYGPNGFQGQRGHPVLVTRVDAAKDEHTAQRLWDASVEMTGVDYAVLAA